MTSVANAAEMEKMKAGGDPMAMCKEMMEKMKKGCC